ncbi:MAG: HEAT repeat domain-containing protein, partial [Deltaproteobacteria bacterium]|nr:HEAT repeat domain-containing protein [Deltaproteobacteria bacterium]
GFYVEPAADKKRQKKNANKKSVKDLVGREDVDNLVQLCFDDKKTFRLMQRLLYDPLDESRWHTAWIIGRVSARVSTRKPGQVSELLHRLFETCSDSAASPWGMVETLGYIISMRPDIFGAFSKHLLNYLGDSTTRPLVLWALAEVAGNRPDLIRDMPFYSLFDFLQDPDPRVRGNTARLLGLIRATEAVIQLMGLSGDLEEFSLCIDGKLTSSTVAVEAAAAIEAIQGGEE